MSGKRNHFAAKIRDDGAVSALCFTSPRKINLRMASWTTRRHAVTCPKCLALMMHDVARTEPEPKP